MKRIVSFLLLFVLFVVILMLPSSEGPIVHHDPLPVWSILLYLTVVAGAGAAAFLMRREKAAPVMA